MQSGDHLSSYVIQGKTAAPLGRTLTHRAGVQSVRFGPYCRAYRYLENDVSVDPKKKNHIRRSVVLSLKIIFAAKKSRYEIDLLVTFRVILTSLRSLM